MPESALGAYLLRRKVGGFPVLDRAIAALSGGWVQRVNHVDDIFVEAINIMHCGLRPGRRRRHGITAYANGQPTERVTSYHGREFVHHEGEFFAAVFEAASRWAPLPRELVAAYSVDVLQRRACGPSCGTRSYVGCQFAQSATCAPTGTAVGASAGPELSGPAVADHHLGPDGVPAGADG